MRIGVKLVDVGVQGGVMPFPRLVSATATTSDQWCDVAEECASEDPCVMYQAVLVHKDQV